VPDALLELRTITKRFGDRVAVDQVSLQLHPGEIFGLLGPNGAGKTTLLRMAVDLLRPDQGELLLLGAPPGPDALSHIGYLPEERGLPLRPRAVELLTYFGELKGLRRDEARAQARELLRRVDLTERARSRIGELSKGNQQKIQIAAALMGRPRVLLVDEPFSGLDPVNRQLVLELLHESVAAGRAVLISTHQLQHVEELCDRLLLLHRGRMVLEGAVREVRRRFADGSLLVRGGGDLSSLPGVERAVAQGERTRLYPRAGVAAADVLRQMLDRGALPEAFEPALPSLEEIFVRVVSGKERALA
jgi:ABC-2 type transport system ATP-binding protein